jgi:2-hydroxycyclohexanecarboxyl-CoA dehydrogenase
MTETTSTTTSTSVPVGRLLQGKVAIVTGGGGGMGRGISIAYAEHGATVIVADIDTGLGAETVKAIEAAGGRAFPVEADVCEAADADRVVRTTMAEFGHVDVLVNNVGHFLVRRPVPFTSSEPEEWDALHRINFLHVLLMTRAVLPHMIAAGGGSIINVTSVEAQRGLPHRPVYGAYKAAAAAFSRSLAVDVGRYGIRVNELAPDMTTSLQLPLDTLLTPDEKETVPLCVPLGRLGTPADSAGVAVFLASDLASYVTGSTVRQDGGTIASSGWFRSLDGRREWTNMPRQP